MKRGNSTVVLMAAAMAASAAAPSAQYEQSKQGMQIIQAHQHSQSPMLGFRSNSKKPGITKRAGLNQRQKRKMIRNNPRLSGKI